MAGFTVGADRVDCRAWINFNANGSITVRDSYNVGSVTDNGTASLTVNFSPALGNINYVASVSCSTDSGPSPVSKLLTDYHPVTNSYSYRTTTTMRISTDTVEPNVVNCAIFGN